MFLAFAGIRSRLPFLIALPKVSAQAEIFPGCLPQASLVLLGVDFIWGFLWFGGGCLVFFFFLFHFFCLRQNSLPIAKEEARECTSYPYLKEINYVPFHLEITYDSGICEKDCVFADNCAVFC